MTSLDQMTTPQQVEAERNQRGLDNPANYGMILGAYNQATQTYIFYYSGWHLYYVPLNPHQGYWTAWQVEMEISLEFDRGETIPVMMAVMDKAAGGDFLMCIFPDPCTCPVCNAAPRYNQEQMNWSRVTPERRRYPLYDPDPEHARE
jgi:hypothetical protein